MVQKISKLIPLVSTLLMFCLIFVEVASPKVAYGIGQITARSLTLQATAIGVGIAGGSDPSGIVNDFFSFTVPSNATVGSIEFQYCTSPIVTGGPSCTTPPGLLTTGATMGTQTGATGFTLVNTTNGTPYLTRTASNLHGPLALTYQLLGVQNPSAVNTSFYVQITTFASTDTSGLPVDQGNVAASTATPIILTGTMPESLVFCTGATVSTSGSPAVPNCSTATAGSVNFNVPFSPQSTAYATSQMAASTNAGTGYAITVNGETLESGGNSIAAISTSAAEDQGTGQFGLNLVSNTTPTVGAVIANTSNGTNLRGEAFGVYANTNFFQFNTGDEVADSGYTSLGGTDAQIYTVSYIVDVPGSQPAGSYTTTLTYICTPTY